MYFLMRFPRIYRVWLRVRFRWVGYLRCRYWYVTRAKKFAKYLEVNFGIVDLQPFGMKNWNPGCHCFTGCFTRDPIQPSVFVKMGGVLKLATREAKAISLVIPHLNNRLCVPRVYVHNEHPCYNFVATSFIQGQVFDVDIVLSQARKSLIGEEAFIEVLLKQMLDIIRALHIANVVHRDVRSSNLLLSFDPVTGFPQLTIIDFALAVSTRNKLPPLILKKHPDRFLAGLGEDMKPDIYVWDDAYSFHFIARRLTRNLRSESIARLLASISEKVGLVEHRGLTNVLSS